MNEEQRAEPREHKAPPGFLPWPAQGPYSGHLAPLFKAGPAHAPVFGAWVERAHCNGRGAAHGGFISSLADIWAAYTLAPQVATDVQLATCHLAVDFLAAARVGDWLQSETDRVRVGRRLGVVTLAIVCAGRPVALARASFVLGA